MGTSPVAVITGAASGMGRALAYALAERGTSLAISDVDEVGLATTAEAARERGAEVLAVRLDVRDAEAFATHAAAVVARFGHVNYLFNNAGVAAAGTVLDQSEADMRFVIDVDLFGVINGTRAFLPHLIASGDGHLVNTSSVFGLIGVPTQSAYNAAKFAVKGYTEALMLEVAIDGHPVTVHCVHPGGVRTNIAESARVTASDQLPDDFTAMFHRFARLSPDKAARIILRGVDRNRRRILVGADAHAIHLIERTLGPRYLGLVRLAASQVLKARGADPVVDVDELAGRRATR